MSAVCERKRKTDYLPPFFQSATLSLAIPGMNHYIATKIVLLDIEPAIPGVCSPSEAALQRNLPKLRPLHAELHGSGSGCSSEMLMSDSKVWSKKKRKTPSSLKISTPFRRSASALFSSHRLQLECPNPTSASRGSEQNQKG